MSGSLYRIVVVLFLALMVPLQGVAAVVSGQCMTLGHHQDAGEGHDGHAHDGDDGHDGHDHGAAGHDDDSKTSHCGPCTACCASASIAGPDKLPLPALFSSPKYTFSQSSPPSVLLDGFDRPPLAL